MYCTSLACKSKRAVSSRPLSTEGRGRRQLEQLHLHLPLHCGEHLPIQDRQQKSRPCTPYSVPVPAVYCHCYLPLTLCSPTASAPSSSFSFSPSRVSTSFLPMWFTRHWTTAHALLLHSLLVVYYCSATSIPCHVRSTPYSVPLVASRHQGAGIGPKTQPRIHPHQNGNRQ